MGKCSIEPRGEFMIQRLTYFQVFTEHKGGENFEMKRKDLKRLKRIRNLGQSISANSIALLKDKVYGKNPD